MKAFLELVQDIGCTFTHMTYSVNADDENKAKLNLGRVPFGDLIPSFKLVIRALW